MFLCEICDAKFEQTPKGKGEWLAHRATHNQKEDASLGQVPRSMSATEIKIMREAEAKEKNRKPKPPKLTYRWEGECPDCLGMLDSITIDAGQKEGQTVAVAFCSSCHKEVAYRPVAKL